MPQDRQYSTKTLHSPVSDVVRFVGPQSVFSFSRDRPCDQFQTQYTGFSRDNPSRNDTLCGELRNPERMILLRFSHVGAGIRSRLGFPWRPSALMSTAIPVAEVRPILTEQNWNDDPPDAICGKPVRERVAGSASRIGSPAEATPADPVEAGGLAA